MPAADAPAAHPPAGTPQKVCSRCGQDCSAKPRSKDPQGRYVCGDCLGKAPPPASSRPSAPSPAQRPSAMQAPAAPARRDSGADDVMSKLVDESLELGKHGCPNCHARMKQSQTICVNCGFNRESGKMLRTVEQKPVVLKQAKSKGGGGRYASFSPGTASFGSLLAMSVLGQCAIAAFSLQGLTGAWAAIAFLGLIALAVWIMGVVIAFQEDQTMWGICGLLNLVPLVNIIAFFAFAFYILVVCDNRVLKAAFIGNFVAITVAYAVAFSQIMSSMSAGGSP